MGIGFPGDVTRRNYQIEPCNIDTSNPPLVFGGLVMVDESTTNGVRQPVAGDNSSTAVYPAQGAYGFLVRSFPLQQQTTANINGYAPLGSGTPPIAGVVDILRSGYIVVPLNTAAGVPNKGGQVFIWVAATTAGHIQGQAETQASAGNTLLLPPLTTFNGPGDAFGNVEVAFNIG
jgi:hypothetical protein